MPQVELRQSLGGEFWSRTDDTPTLLALKTSAPPPSRLALCPAFWTTRYICEGDTALLALKCPDTGPPTTTHNRMPAAGHDDLVADDQRAAKAVRAIESRTDALEATSASDPSYMRSKWKLGHDDSEMPALTKPKAKRQSAFSQASDHRAYADTLESTIRHERQ